jgi:hypothetical protein
MLENFFEPYTFHYTDHGNYHSWSGSSPHTKLWAKAQIAFCTHMYRRKNYHICTSPEYKAFNLNIRDLIFCGTPEP